MIRSVVLIITFFLLLPIQSFAGQRDSVILRVQAGDEVQAFYGHAKHEQRITNDRPRNNLRILGLFSLILGSISFWGFRIVGTIGGLTFSLLSTELVGVLLTMYLSLMWIGLFAGAIALIGLIAWLVKSRELNQELGMLLAGLALSAFAAYVGIFFFGFF
ncbi:MAG: hypothetical protein AAF206_06350 [Bacteroidota bacterium]